MKLNHIWFINVNKKYKCWHKNKLALSRGDYQITNVLEIHEIGVRKENIITPKCVLIYFGFHYILNEFGFFTTLKLINPLVNMDQLLRIVNWSIST
jgi:hypothetical protein